MERLMQYSKEELFYMLYPEIGDTHTIEEIKVKTGISSIPSIKAYMWRFRHPEKFNRPANMQIQLSMKNGSVLRIS